MPHFNVNTKEPMPSQTSPLDPDSGNRSLNSVYVSVSSGIWKLNGCTISIPILLVTNERHVRHGIPEKVCSDIVLDKVRKKCKKNP